MVAGCRTEKKKNKDRKPSVALKVKSPSRDASFTVGDDIKVEIEILDSTNVKNLTVTFDELIIQENLDPVSQTVTINTEDMWVGYSTVHISYNDMEGKARKATRNVILFSDIVPEQKIASIVKTYPHSTNSYTQGLEFYKGNLFESTGSGDGNKSFIATVDLNSGKHLKYKELDNPGYFGEGITILNDTIYQLTWQAQRCFVYDLDFNYIKTFEYQGDGWGLTNDGTSLIMSNGSSRIAWRNPTTFEIEREIDVFGNQKEVNQLNELELINGDLWCNVYQSNYLVQVEINTGKVLSYIDCAGIAFEGRDQYSNVLNGIAYDAANEKLYLTGKLWPKLFEVKID